MESALEHGAATDATTEPLVWDAAFVRRYRAGHRKTLETIFTAYAPSLTQYVHHGFLFRSKESWRRFRGLQSRFDVHDVLHEVFTRAFSDRVRRDYDERSSFLNFLRRIARNHIIDRLRSPASRWEPLCREATETLEQRASRGANPARVAERRELRALMRSFFGQRPGGDQELIRLRFHEGLSQEAVAERLGCSRRWVRTTESTVRLQLAAHLRDTGYLPAAGAARKSKS